MLIVPDWKLPAGVKALLTTRSGGISKAPYAEFNLALHVGDDPGHVFENRRLLRERLPAEPLWLDQVHGVRVARWSESASMAPPVADASVAFQPDQVCVVMTADCLPVLFSSRNGDVVAAAHAGWRGLLNDVLEETVRAMSVSPSQVEVWLGPAIGPGAFEVGDEVRAAFVERDVRHASAFRKGSQAGKWLADLFMLARQRLAWLGVGGVRGGGVCTWTEQEQFFSYRRDGVTGRFASLIWIDETHRAIN